MLDIILEFQSTNFEKDKSLLTNLLMDYVKKFKLMESTNNVKNDESNDNDSTKSNSDPTPDKSKELNSVSSISFFNLTSPHEIAGWSFAKLSISNNFLFEILKEITTTSNVTESELVSDRLFNLVTKYKPQGKHYQTSEYKIIMFIVWVNDNLKQLGSDSFVKIGEDMGESTSPGGFSTGPSVGPY